MEVIQLTNSVYLLHASVNMGLVRTEAGFVAIDTGIDKQSGKQLLKTAKGFDAPLTAIINTHAHSDHFGGNATILAAGTSEVYAPVYEADVIRRPRYEPEYLWHGAKPVPALLTKFLEASPSVVTYEFVPGDAFEIGSLEFRTVSLPGHSFGQAGILVDNVFFAADSYFSMDVIRKHGIPFMVNYEQTFASAKLVLAQEAHWYVPGHGPAVTKPPQEDVTFLLERHTEIYSAIVDLVTQAGSIPFEELNVRVCSKYAVVPESLPAYVLLRASISAYITYAIEQGIMDVGMQEGKVVLLAK